MLAVEGARLSLVCWGSRVGAPPRAAGSASPGARAVCLAPTSLLASLFFACRGPNDLS